MTEKEKKYTVLARKYRPQTFKDLIGQDALVQTLTNAIKQDRIASAYLLTGIRGVGKTSTARIIAKALTCVGADGKGKATPEPCGVCENCKAITESRHVDVLEMDAASRTGVGDIREIIDNANYLPSTARCKIYIIDEVHMLSKSAFNALLKTLEEPPPHVKFIFATTEVRKIPVTILSRCQRFDLPRVGSELLEKHLAEVAKNEGVEIDADALRIIARVAEGSVRDALSLLDQAIAHGGSSKKVDTEQVSNMLGLLGKTNLIELYSFVAEGKVKEAVIKLREMYRSGADPVMILQDMLELTHVLTQMKVIADLSDTAHYAKGDLEEIRKIVEKLELSFLARMWQMLVKGMQEVNIAPNSLMAVEMILIRIAYSSGLPTPGDLVRKIEKNNTMATPPAPSAKSAEKVTEGALLYKAAPKNFEAMVELFREQNEQFLYNWLQNEVHPVKFEKGKVEIRLTEAAPRDLPNRIMACLQGWTNERWMVIVSNEEGKDTIRQKINRELEDEKAKAAEDKDVKLILETFPGAKITSIEPIKEELKEKIQEENERKIKTGEQQ